MTTLTERTFWIEADAPRRASAASPGGGFERAAARLAAAEASPSSGPFAPGDMGAGGRRARLSIDSTSGWLNSLTTGALRGPLDAETHWRGLELDHDTLRELTVDELSELLSDLSPEVSGALWQFLRFANPGWEIIASRPGGAMAGKGRHQAAVDAFLKTLEEKHGGLDLVINRLLLSAFLRGALLAELVLSKTGREPLTIAVPDPASLVFKKEIDPEIGERWVIGQQQRTQWVRLEGETIAYVPIDPLPGRPEGRAPVGPAIFSALFLLAMFHDLRRVIQQQGYPRIDLEIDLEKVLMSMPAGVKADPQKMAAWIKETIQEIQETYESLEPDDSYVHLNTVRVNRPVGTLDSSSLSAVDAIIVALERMLVRALKTQPILMGVTDGVSEANVRVQWKIYAASLRAIQHPVESILSRFFRLALEAQGIPCEIEVKFADASIVDRLLDVQIEAGEMANAVTAYNQGWIDQDTAAKKGAGVDQAAEEEPRGAAMAREIAEKTAGGGGDTEDTKDSKDDGAPTDDKAKEEETK